MTFKQIAKKYIRLNPATQKYIRKGRGNHVDVNSDGYMYISVYNDGNRNGITVQNCAVGKNHNFLGFYKHDSKFGQQR